MPKSKDPLPLKIRATILEITKPTVATPGLAEALADRITVRIGELLEEEGLI